MANEDKIQEEIVHQKQIVEYQHELIDLERNEEEELEKQKKEATDNPQECKEVLNL